MSYAFDTLMAVWQRRVEPLLEDKELARLLEALFEEMHDANHTAKRPDRQGKLWGDAVNKAAGVGRVARELQAYDTKLGGIW